MPHTSRLSKLLSSPERRRARVHVRRCRPALVFSAKLQRKTTCCCWQHGVDRRCSAASFCRCCRTCCQTHSAIGLECRDLREYLGSTLVYFFIIITLSLPHQTTSRSHQIRGSSLHRLSTATISPRRCIRACSVRWRC